MKIKDIVGPLLKWWWMIAIATLLAGSVSYLATRNLPPIYQTRATLLVGRAIYDPNPTGTEFGLSRQLAEAYADIAQRDGVRAATIKALGLEQQGLPAYIARALPNSPVIEIIVTDTSRERAQAVANELANQVLLQSPTNPQQQEQQRLEFLNKQLDDMQTEIETTREQLNEKQQALANMTSAVQIADTQAEINALQNKLTILQTNYAALYANTEGGAINTISIIEKASLPDPRRPIGPNKPLVIALAALAGLLLSSGAAHLIEFLDRSIRTPEDVERILGVPVIGYIGQLPAGKEGYEYVATHPRTPLAEAFRALRTNLEFAGVDRPLKTILITSAEMGEGKTIVSTNLALSLSQSEKKVLLIDVDLRRPNIHETLEIPNQPGLTDVFRERLNIFDIIRTWKDRHVAIITAGSIPPNPTELLGSKRMDQTLDSLRDVLDIIILDGPPFMVSDAAVLAAKVDGVVLVIQPGQTREDMVRAMKEQLSRAGARVVGVILNRIGRASLEAYGGYRYYAPYFSQSYYYSEPSANGKNATPAEKGEKKGWFRRPKKEPAAPKN